MGLYYGVNMDGQQLQFDDNPDDDVTNYRPNEQLIRQIWDAVPGAPSVKLDAVAKAGFGASSAATWAIKNGLISPEDARASQSVGILTDRGYGFNPDGSFVDTVRGGFSWGGNELGLWPVLAGTGAFAAAGAAGLGGATSASAAPTASGVGGAGATQYGLAGAESAAAGGTGTVSTGALEGGGMDWWDQLMMETGEAGVDASSLEGGFNASGTGDWWDQLMMETGEYGVDANSLEGGFNPAGVGGPELGGAAFSGSDLLRGGSLIKGLLGGAGNILGGLKGVLPSADTALAMAPILAAISYAKNQGGFDTSRLESTYDQFDPNALAFEYDQNTSRGREGLTSSLTNRGVMGSSFGNMDITNFNTTRDMGRRSLINQGTLARADPAKAILDAQIKERALKNQLYGQSLLAMGNVFGGKRS